MPGKKHVRAERRKAAFLKERQKKKKKKQPGQAQDIPYVRDPEKRPWTPFEDITSFAVSRTMIELGLTQKSEAYRRIFGTAKGTVYQNSHYLVTKRVLFDADAGGKDYFQLSIRNLENNARHDWREFQRIKNELCGPEYEAVELYPAESRLTDSSNQFFLWVLPEGERVRYGFTDRLVMNQGGRGAQQRPFRKDQLPADCITQEEYDAQLLALAAEVTKETNTHDDREPDIAIAIEIQDAEPAGVCGPADPGGPDPGPLPVDGGAGSGVQDPYLDQEAGQDQDAAGEADPQVGRADAEDCGPLREPVAEGGSLGEAGLGATQAESAGPAA